MRRYEIQADAASSGAATRDSQVRENVGTIGSDGYICNFRANDQNCTDEMRGVIQPATVEFVALTGMRPGSAAPVSRVQALLNAYRIRHM